MKRVKGTAIHQSSAPTTAAPGGRRELGNEVQSDLINFAQQIPSSNPGFPLSSQLHCWSLEELLAVGAPSGAMLNKLRADAEAQLLMVSSRPFLQERIQADEVIAMLDQEHLGPSEMNINPKDEL